MMIIMVYCSSFFKKTPSAKKFFSKQVMIDNISRISFKIETQRDFVQKTEIFWNDIPK